jgi:hypothetical protein
MEDLCLFNKPDLSDLSITIIDSSRSVTIFGHKTILANRSGFFNRAIRFNNLSKLILDITEYGRVDDCLYLIENCIYRCEMVTFELITGFTLLLNYLAIDNKVYDLKYLIHTKFIISNVSASSNRIRLSVVQNDANMKASSRTDQTEYLEFVSLDGGHQKLMTCNKYLCRNEEFIDFLIHLVPGLMIDKKITKRGLTIDNFIDIQNVIKALYQFDAIISNGYPYSNILVKSIFHNVYDIIDPIYAQTKAISDIPMESRDAGWTLSISWKIFPCINNCDYLSIYIDIEKDKFKLYRSGRENPDKYPKFAQVVDWLTIFLDPNLDFHSMSKKFKGVTLLRENEKDVQIYSGILSYIYVANLLPTTKTTKHPDSEKIIDHLKQFLGLVIDNEFDIKTYDLSNSKKEKGHFFNINMLPL